MKIVICGNTEHVQNHANLPRNLEHDEAREAAEAWFYAAREAAQELGDVDVDTNFRHYNGGCRYGRGHGLIDIEDRAGSLSTDDLAVEAVQDWVRLAGELAAWRAAIGGVEVLLDGNDPEDFADGEEAQARAHLAAWTREADGIRADLGRAQKLARLAWAKLEHDDDPLVCAGSGIVLTAKTTAARK
ncbi:MAG: hypothetical protein WC421_11740 [Elusimicrobiales bacterium]